MSEDTAVVAEKTFMEKAALYPKFVMDNLLYVGATALIAGGMVRRMDTTAVKNVLGEDALNRVKEKLPMGGVPIINA